MKYTLHYGDNSLPVAPEMADSIRQSLEVVCSTGRSGLMEINDAYPREGDGKSVVDHFTLLIGPGIPVALQTTVETGELLPDWSS